MKKLITILLVLLSTSCSRASLEKGGWVPPMPQKSKFMKVTGGGFLLDLSQGKVKAKYSVIVELSNLDKSKKYWIFAEFENPAQKGSLIKKTFPLKPKQPWENVKSEDVVGVKNYNAYLVKIQLSTNQSGSAIIDSLDQYIRATGFNN